MVVNQINITNLSDLTDLIRFINPWLGQVTQAMSNGVTFQDNIRASIIKVTFPSTANQNLQVIHKLNATPVGYLPIRLSSAATVYDGVSPAVGSSVLNLKCTVASVNVTLLVF